MGATWAGRLSATFGMLLICAATSGATSRRPAGRSRTPASRRRRPSRPAKAPAARPATPRRRRRGRRRPRAGGETAAAAGANAASARGRCEGGPGRDARAAEAPRQGGRPGHARRARPSKALREILEERLHWLDEWDKAAKALHDAEHPEPSPERQAAELKAELERVKALLDQAAKDPEALLPAVFRNPAGQLTDAARAEMKEALDAAKGELKDWKAKLEKLRADTRRRATPCRRCGSSATRSTSGSPP